VLVVEDDDALRRAIARSLADRGFEVTAVEEASEAATLLARGRYDVLLTDLRLRNDSGIDLIREASSIAPQTRTVLMSAFATARDHEVATNLGAVRVLSKPFEPEELVDAVRQAVESESGFRGSVHGLSLVDLLQMYHFSRRSITIVISGSVGGEIYIVDGEIVHATSGEISGEDAIRVLLSHPSGSIRTSAKRVEVPRTIDRTFDSLVLDALRVIDEESVQEDTGWIDRITFSPPPMSSPEPSGPSEPALVPAENQPVKRRGTTMGKIDDACREVVGKVEGASACGVVDLDTGMLLGIYNSAGYTQTLNEVVAAATMDLFRGPNVGRVEQMVRAHRGVPENGEHYFQEVHITSAHNYHFAKVIKGGKAVIMLVTKKTTNIGMGWAMLKSVIPSVEPHVP
jgi:CheY-like chemotaxis protein